MVKLYKSSIFVTMETQFAIQLQAIHSNRHGTFARGCNNNAVMQKKTCGCNNNVVMQKKTCFLLSTYARHIGQAAARHR